MQDVEIKKYTLTVKVILFVLIFIVIMGLLAGMISARLEINNFLKKYPQGSRVIQTVQTQTADGSSFISTIESEKGKVVGFLDQNKNIVKLGTALTADGLIVTPADGYDARSVSLLMADGRTVNGQRVRAYPEKGVIFYRVGNYFSAPQFSALEQIVAGTEGILIALVKNNARIAVLPETVEYFSTEETLDNAVFRERQLKLAVLPNSNYYGAPFFDAKHNLLGILVNREKGLVLPASEISFLLQDYLKHGDGETVTLFDGLVGTWINKESENGKFGASFAVEMVERNSVFAKAGLQSNDFIYAVNDKNFPTAQLWGTFLESMRAVKPVTLGVLRNNSALKIPISVIIKNAEQQ